MRKVPRGLRVISGVATILIVASSLTSTLSAQPSLVSVQASALTRIPTTDAPPSTTLSDETGTQALLAADAQKAPWWAPAVSAVVPGAGQFVLGQQRSVAYLVAEGFLVVQALSAQRDGNRDRNEYRALASDVARRNFGQSRPTGPWEYYESMEKFLESGVFDKIAGGAVNPETDETTFNGARWRLARETFWRNPLVAPPDTSAEYARALDFYVSRAVRDEYRWSWRDAQLQQDVYRQTIASANRSYQRAVNLAGLIGANHLTSVIDAYVTVRIRRYGGVRVAGLQLDGIDNSVQFMGDPATGRTTFRSGLRFVPAP